MTREQAEAPVAFRSLSERVLSLRGFEDPGDACRDFLREIAESLACDCVGILRHDGGSLSAFRWLSRWPTLAESPVETAPVTSALYHLATRVLAGRESIHEADLSGGDPTGSVSAIGIPLGDPKDGIVLVVLSGRPGGFDPEAERNIEKITGVARLHATSINLASRLERQEILGHCARTLSDQIASGASDEELFDGFTRFVGEAFDADMACIYILSEDRQWMHRRPMYDRRPGVLSTREERNLYIGDKPDVIAVVTTARVVDIPDVLDCPMPEEWKDLAREGRLRSVVAAPLPSAAGHTGFVVIGRENPGELLSPDNRDLFQVLVQQAAPLLENARMVRELRHHLNGLAHLLETSREVSSQLDLSEVPGLLARRAMELTASDEGLVLLLEPDGKTLKPVLALSEYEAEMMKIRCTIGEGIAGHVALTRVGEFVNRVDLDPRSRHIPGTPVEPEAMLSVPLVCADSLLGVMSLYKLDGRRYNGTDLATINIFATQAAIAIENATLFQSMAAERSRLSTMIHQMEEAVFFCEPSGVILVLNSAARKLVDAPDAVGRRLFDVAVEALNAPLREAMQHLLSGEIRNVTREFRIDERFQMGSFTVIRDERNAVTGLIVLCKDVTELKSMEAQLLQSSKMSAVGQLASGVAHEFNNLIAAIYGYAQFMKSNREERVLTKGIDIILNSSERARDLTRSLLTFSRASEDRFEAADVNEILSDAVLLVEQQIAKEGIRLVRNPGRLPHAWVERGRLIEVFLNLISNARHAMPDGGTLTLSTREAGDCLVVEVSDTGMGIPSSNLGRLFDPFFTTKGPLNGTRTPGTGLGLFTVYNVIHAHGGQVVVESTQEQGTTVRIQLPIRRGPVVTADTDPVRRAG